MSAPTSFLSIENRMRKEGIQADSNRASDSENRNTPSRQAPAPVAPRRGEVIPVSRQSFGAPPYRSPRTSFSLLDRARPVFSFSSGKKKRKWGVQRTSHLHGCNPPTCASRFFANPSKRPSIPGKAIAAPASLAVSRRQNPAGSQNPLFTLSAEATCPATMSPPE